MHLLARNWGWVALRGLAALLFGLLTLLRPGMTLTALMLLFGAFAFADGGFTLASALLRRRQESLWPCLLFGGLVGVALGGFALVAPGRAALVPLYLIGAWAVLAGLAGVASGLRLRKAVPAEWRLALTGALGLVLGLLLLLLTCAGALMVMLSIGVYACLAGILLLLLALRLRKQAQPPAAAEAPPTA